ncbi:hypothetical protein D3C86_2108870 [compost metagenome]
MGRLQGFMVQPAEGAGHGHAAQDPAHERRGAASDEKDRQRHAQAGDRAENALQ